MKIEELVAGEWVPFDQTDVQVDYHRLDPFVRRTLTNKDPFTSMNLVSTCD